jgi:hypothetical protein
MSLRVGARDDAGQKAQKKTKEQRTFLIANWNGHDGILE